MAGREFVTSLTKFYTLVLLRDSPMHGYELMDELEKRLGKRPSTGQIYPLLSTLEKRGLITHKQKNVRGRRKKVYSLTQKGKKTTSRAMNRFSDIISAVIEPKLTECAHCGCKIYEGGFKKRIGKRKRTLMFCCEHCAHHYKKGR